MKLNSKLALAAGFFLIQISFLSAQNKNIKGTWSGTIQTKTMNAFIVFRIDLDTANVYSGVLDSPDQFAFDIKFGKVKYEHDSVFLSVPSLSANYKGIVKDSLMKGTWKQSGMKFSLNMRRDTIYKKPDYKRPQEPKPPFPYKEEEVVFQNKKAGIQLAGTLTIPEHTAPAPVVVLITGSGPQDRNEELLKHKPFLVIADYLTRQGIAVLRFDDRGVGKSTGTFSKATTADFATDVDAAVKYLKSRKDIDKKNIGLIGHSEGGMIAPMVAASNKSIAFIVLLAGPGVKIDQLMLKQLELISRDSKVNDSIINLTKAINTDVFHLLQTGINGPQVPDKIKEIYNNHLKNYSDDQKKEMGLSAAATEAAIIQLLSPWFRYFLNFDAHKYLSALKCPVLALNGGNDHQVFSKDNLPAIKKALEDGKNKDFMILELPGLNHLFQNCHACTFAEYAKLEETFSPTALDAMSSWIKKHIKK